MKMRFAMLMFMMGVLTACGDKAPHQSAQVKTYVVQRSKLSKTLFFTGLVLPRLESTLLSPMEAVVKAMPYHYGQHVKKGEEVFLLNSQELQKQYNETLTDYLKSKDNYTVARAKFTGTEDLWQAGLIAKNQYLSEKSSLNTTRITLMQATHKLTDMITKMGDDSFSDLSHLSFSEFDRVRMALSAKHDLIHLKAPAEGVLLYPPKGSDDKSGRITIGTQVKAGQVLALIGDLKGLRVEIDVPEVDLDKIKLGMKALVRGVAFQNQALTGRLVAINNQASSNGGSALPSFTAVVVVNGLNKKQQSFIKVGMSASIELVVDSVEKLMVPISAVSQRHEKSIVHVRAADGKISERTVVTGAAEASRVIIESGLHEGEVVTHD